MKVCKIQITVTYIWRVFDQSFDQELHSKFKRCILALVYELLKSVSVTRSL